MKKVNIILQRLFKFSVLLGFNPLKTYSFFKGLGFYWKDLRKISRQKGSNNDFDISLLPILDERFSGAGTLKGHYFHQDLLVAKRIYKNNPVKHVDIGSRIDGFVAHLAVFRELEVFDVRVAMGTVENIIFKQADFMELDDKMIDYCDSISSLHAIEHFGLGRYGDIIDYFGHIKALNNIAKILKKGGKFYFSAPIGKQRIEFNAHRVFSVSYLIKLLTDKYNIDSFSYVNDEGILFKNVAISDVDVQSNYGCSYGCGIFEMTKK